MHILLKAKAHLAIVSILAILLLVACTSPATTPTPSSNESSEITTPSDKPANSQTPSEPADLPVRVDVVYFHRPQRCPTCLCFEERIRYVMSTCFQNELAGGQMTFGVYDIGDSKNTDIVKKYGAVGSQLFINIVKNGTDNVSDIQDIWSWNCRSNKTGFDRQVKDIIERSLAGEE